MRTEEEIRERIKQNREKMGAERIADSHYRALYGEIVMLKWVLGED